MKPLEYPTLFVCSLLMLEMPVAAAEDPKSDPYTARIIRNAKTKTTSIRVAIPKSAHEQGIQSVYLQRKSATGLDVHVPVAYQEEQSQFTVFLLIPAALAEDAVLRVTHHRAIKPGPDGSFVVPMGVRGGESYEIPLREPEPGSKEVPTPTRGDASRTNEVP